MTIKDGFSAPNSCSLQWLVKCATQLCTSKKDCNKLDLTAAQYFWLVVDNDWSRWFAISSSHVHAVPFTVLLVGLHGLCQTVWTRHTYSAQQTKDVLSKKNLGLRNFYPLFSPSIYFSTSDSGLYVLSRLTNFVLPQLHNFIHAFDVGFWSNHQLIVESLWIIPCFDRECANVFFRIVYNSSPNKLSWVTAKPKRKENDLHKF